MKSVVLIPLYRPNGRHVLLLQSALSACPSGQNFVFLIAADGPNSEVKWNEGDIEPLLRAAESKRVEIRFFSYLQSYGYPGCFQQLIADALQIEELSVIHFLDQDDYCLPNRFAGRRPDTTMASGAFIVDVNFRCITTHRFDASIRTGLLETPAPGMTISATPTVAKDYVELCVTNSEVRRAPHDYVISQLAIRSGAMATAVGASMLYIQHTGNTIGYVRGMRWVLKKIVTAKTVLRRTTSHATILDILYGHQYWEKSTILHRNAFRSFVYQCILMIWRWKKSS